MPNELNIALPTSGLTVTAQPYQAGAAVGSAISLTEVGSSGFYSGTMTGTAGTYQLAFLAAGANVGSGSIVWDGTNEVATSTLTQAGVQSALTAQGLTSVRAGALDNLDTTVSSRLSPSGTLARVTLTDTATTLTNAPTVPSASAIASQVRTELTTELGRIDAAISTRATPANIPTSDITAIKGKTDLLNTTRLGQVATTEIVGNLLAQANS